MRRPRTHGDLNWLREPAIVAFCFRDKRQPLLESTSALLEIQETMNYWLPTSTNYVHEIPEYWRKIRD